MPRVKKVNTTPQETVTPPPMSPEAQQNRMISMAINCAEKQLRDGTASSQIICHYLKMASEKDKLELEKTRAEVELMKAKAKQLESQERMEQLYAGAIQAMSRYGGSSLGDEDDEEDLY